MNAQISDLYSTVAGNSRGIKPCSTWVVTTASPVFTAEGNDKLLLSPRALRMLYFQKCVRNKDRDRSYAIGKRKTVIFHAQ